MKFYETTFDDYLPHHFIPLDSANGISLSSNTSYYYKLSGYDYAGLYYQTACLNFTTAAANSSLSLQTLLL